MKRTIITITASTLLTLSALAGWEPRGICHVWTGSEEPDKARADMLEGEFYDYNRNPKGNFFTYSGIYQSGQDSPINARSLSAITKARKTGAKNPTNSPDVHGQFAYTLKELMNGRYDILKNTTNTHRRSPFHTFIYLPSTQSNRLKMN